TLAHSGVDAAGGLSMPRVGLARGIEVAAEGVDAEAAIPGLREAGVGLVRGFSLHRPCPLEGLWHTPQLVAVSG
ncbi:hypothetical protein, partial [Pseudoxanthomonas jiangsuensis]|uniref:hypothetical protein n=1 Tax=Pseudoxanthomonas jiangsuensis TaxID=619688 RepID=UPI0013908980